MIRALASELRSDAGTGRLPAALATGSVVALLVVAVQTSLASIIFSGPLASFVDLGTGATLFGACTLCLVTALTGTYRGTVSLPQFPPAAALVTIAGAAATSMPMAPDKGVFATVVVIIALTTLTTALGFSVIGHLRLANLFRFMPYPLVGGFLAGLGWVLTLSGIEITSGFALSWETLPRLLDPEIAWRWAASLTFALALLLATKRWSHFLIGPAAVMISIGLCHGALFVLGITGEEARAAGILFVGMPDDTSWPPVGRAELQQVDWSVVASQIPGILSVTLIALMCIVLNAGALELGTGITVDMNREFCAEGAACAVAGLGASPPGCNVVGVSLMSHASGAETRLTGIVVALAVGSVLFLGGELLGALPVPLLGGLVLFIGLGLLNDWIVEVRKSLPLSAYGIVLVVSVVIVVFGFVEGVAVGLATAVIFFVVHFSRVSVIGASFTAREQRSNRDRSAIHRAILRDHGDRVSAYRLCGYIIFGNASPLGERVMETLKTDPAPLCLVLDFGAVSGFDVSAANVICRCIRTARSQNTWVVLSNMPEQARRIVRRALRESEWEDLIFHEDLHRSLEHCEDLVIAEWEEFHAGSKDARDALFASSIDQAVRQMEMQARFEELTERLRPWLEERAYAPGETIVARGESHDAMLLLIEGRATAFATHAGARIDEYGPGDALMPEAALGTHVAPLSVAAAEPCRTLLMTLRVRQSIERDDPALTMDLDRYLIETIVEHHKRLLPPGGAEAAPESEDHWGSQPQHQVL